MDEIFIYYLKNTGYQLLNKSVKEKSLLHNTLQNNLWYIDLLNHVKLHFILLFYITHFMQFIYMIKIYMYE